MKDSSLSTAFKVWVLVTVALAFVTYVYGIFSSNPFAEARTTELTPLGMSQLKHYFALSLALELSLLYPLRKNSWVTARPVVILMIVSSLFYVLLDVGIYLQGQLGDPGTALVANGLKVMLLVVYSLFFVSHERALVSR